MRRSVLRVPFHSREFACIRATGTGVPSVCAAAQLRAVLLSETEDAG